MTALALSPTELQSLINRGIVSIRPRENPDLQSMHAKAWRLANREKYLETKRKYYEKNKAKILAADKARYELNGKRSK